MRLTDDLAGRADNGARRNLRLTRAGLYHLIEAAPSQAKLHYARGMDRSFLARELIDSQLLTDSPVHSRNSVGCAD